MVGGLEVGSRRRGAGDVGILCGGVVVVKVVKAVVAVLF